VSSWCSRGSASDVISPADRAASTAYPGSHRIITRKMAHYYHYYFIFPPLQRGPETTEKQKAREININKSSGRKNGRCTGWRDTRGWKERAERAGWERGRREGAGSRGRKRSLVHRRGERGRGRKGAREERK
jgi:hypothetical protein